MTTPEGTDERASPPPAPPEPPACDLSRTAAEERAAAWLTAAAGTSELPGDFTAFACESHCRIGAGRGRREIEPCGSWECPFRYGHPRSRLASHWFHVFIAGCGATIFTARPYARCFQRAHACRLAVDRQRALALAQEHLGEDVEISAGATALLRAPEQSEFHWRIPFGAPTEGAVRVSAHAEQVWLESVDPAAP